MSVRYEIPDPEDADRPQSEEDKRLGAIAKQASIEDPSFHNWKWWYWTGVRSVTVIVFCISVVGMFALTLEEHPTRENRDQRPNRALIFIPLCLALGAHGAGSWFNRLKLREMAMRAITEKPKD